MREIKFRGLRTDGKGFVYGFYSPVNVPILGTLGHCINEGGYRAIDIIIKSLGQFTGLKDKNGKDIYEGDIVKSKKGNSSLGGQNDVYKIYWDEKHCAFGYWTISSDNKYRIDKPITTRDNKPFLIGNPNTEIIGNIHENPELVCKQN